jgi:hypothetical protein
LDHLSFLSRDGELLLEMARAMPADHWSGVSLSYLHCSRWSWLLAGASALGLDEWLDAGTSDPKAFIHANRHRVPLRSLLGRIGLTPADIEGHPELAALRPERPIPPAMAATWEALLADPAIGELILARSEARRHLLVDYVSRLGLPGRRVGIVDVGWRGRLAWVVSAILREVTGHEPVHLHFGGDKVLPDVDRTIDIRRFAFDGVTRSYPLTNPVSCVETITASGSPKLIGYERHPDGSVQPVHAKEVTSVHHRDRDRLWAGAARTARHLPSLELLDQLGAAADPLGSEANRVLSLWWTRPVRAEVEAMRSLAFEADDDGHAIRPLITPYSPRELSPSDKQPRQWRQGSVAVTPWPYGPALGGARWLRARLARAGLG